MWSYKSKWHQKWNHETKTEPSNKFHSKHFFVWKQKIDFILTYREVDEVVSNYNAHRTHSPEFAKWTQCDKLARAIIGLSWSDDMLKHVREASSAKEMLESISNVFQWQTLRDMLRARRDFYTVKIKRTEKILSYINSVQQLESFLKSMDVEITSEEMEMAVLNVPPSRYENIITALDDVPDEKLFKLDVVESRLLQEEQRSATRAWSRKDEWSLPNTSSYSPSCWTEGGHKWTFRARKGRNVGRCCDNRP